MEGQMTEIRTFLEEHLKGILDNDISSYEATTSSDLTLYEWYVTPHRIDGLPFHEFMMIESSRKDTAGMALDPNPTGEQSEEKPRARFDVTNYKEQRYNDTAVCSYTLLISKGSSSGVRVLSYNETRVVVRMEDGWKVVHVHKSPTWNAPFQPPNFTRIGQED